MLGLLPERFRGQFQPSARIGRKAAPNPDTLLTGTQVGVHNALVTALLVPSALIVLTGAAGLGKTRVLAAALASIADPLLQVVRLGADHGMDQSFKLLFGAGRYEEQRTGTSRSRMILVADQAETLPSGAFAYLELLTRMPGKDASVQLVISGRPEFRDCIDDVVADRFRTAVPVQIVLPPLSEQDAWDLFHHRVNSIYRQQSARRIVLMLLERSGGLPGRFDQALHAAVAGGLLEAAPG